MSFWITIVFFQVFDDDLGKDDLLGKALLDTRMIVKERCFNPYCKMNQWCQGKSISRLNVTRVAEVARMQTEKVWTRTKKFTP